MGPDQSEVTTVRVLRPTSETSAVEISVEATNKAHCFVAMLMRHGFKIETVSAALVSNGEPLDRRYIAVAVPNIDAVGSLLGALAELDAHSMSICSSILMVNDNTHSDTRLAVLVGVMPIKALPLH
jgi:hypothetical protein